MLTLQQVLEFLNERKDTDSPPLEIKRWRDVYYGITLHTTGACPQFFLRGNNTIGWKGRLYSPPNFFGIQYQALFENHLMNRYPRESEEMRNYRFSIYRPLTQAPFSQIMEMTTGTIIQDSNYSIDIPNKSDSDYIFGTNFDGKDLMGYFAEKLRSIFEDPNGFFAVVPKKPGYMMQPDEQIEPDIWFVNTKDVWKRTKDEVLFWRDGYIWLINIVGIFRFAPRNEGDNTEWYHVDETQGGYYGHDFEYIPMHVAGGTWNTQGFYDSFLQKSKPIADKYISSESAEQLVDKEGSHPFITMAATECPTCKGIGQVQRVDEDGVPTDLVACTHAGCVNGYISNNPGDRLIVPIEKMQNKLIQIENPDVGINKYLTDKNKEILDAIRQALHIYTIDEAQSGTAKELDMESRYQFFCLVSDNLFDIINKCISDIIAYRNLIVVNGYTRPHVYEFTIIRPSQFQIKTAADLLNDFTKGIEGAVPVFVRVRLMNDYVDKQFGGDLVMKKKSVIIGMYDKLCTLSVDEKQILEQSGGISNRDLQLNVEMPQIIDNIVYNKGSEWFVNAHPPDIKALIDIEFAKIPEIKMPATAKAGNASAAQDAGAQNQPVTETYAA